MEEKKNPGLFKQDWRFYRYTDRACYRYGYSILLQEQAVGNAGVPMGCYFLTLSLMAGMGMDISLMGVILPIYTIIDMVETAENVWSDSCVCAITDRSMAQYTDK